MKNIIFKYLKNNRGELDALNVPMKLLLSFVIFITFFTLLVQNNQHKNYHAILDDMARVYLLKPMEEEGGLTREILSSFEKELEKKGIKDKVVLEDATWYPVDRGQPVEVKINSYYEVRALAYIGGPVLKRPTPVKKIGVSQQFFR